MVRNNEINNLLYDERGEISEISINNGIMDSVVESGRPFGIVTGQVNHFAASHAITKSEDSCVQPKISQGLTR